MSLKKGTAGVHKKVKALKMKKIRDKEGLFVCEGLRFVSEIPREWEIEFYAADENFCQKEEMKKFENRADVYVFGNKDFADMSDTENPQGILAICRKKKFSLEEIASKGGFFVLCEELNDPGNLGTIIRTADAAAADAVVLSKGSVDVYNGKVLRSTMGSVFHIPVITDVNIEEAVETLKKNGIKIYAAHLKGTKTPYEFDLREKTAYLIGNEANGLKEKTASLADSYVKIPMPGKSESLNASVAAALLMYETVRQREVSK